MASPQTIENIRGVPNHYGALSTRAGAFQPLRRKRGRKSRVPTSCNGTDFAIADLCTWYPLQSICNSLKKKDIKAEESRTIHYSFYLTTEYFRFMIVSVPGFTERLAEQGEDGF